MFHATTLALSTSRIIAVTFANAGNCQGIALGFYISGTTAASTYKLVIVDLEEAKTMTVTIASPGVVTSTGHGLAANQQIRFATTGALPTGITAGTLYYVIATGLTADTFQFSTSVGGAAVNTSGTQSGTHTLWVMRTTETQTGSEIYNSTDNAIGCWNVAFDFDTPYAVDTTALKWRFYLYQGSGTYNHALMTSDGTAPFYATWCNNQVSFTNNDTVIVKDACIVDQTATARGILGTGETAKSCAVIILKNTDPTAANVCNFRWENPPASAYTLTVNGHIVYSAHAGMRIGTSASRIPNAQMATISFPTPTYGTTGGPISSLSGTSGAYAVKGSLLFYGEIPAVEDAILVADAALLQAVIVTTVATGWAIGDTVFVGKRNTPAQSDTTTRTISNIAGDTITLSSNLTGALAKAGGRVVRLNGYGIRVVGTSGITTNINMGLISNLVFSGCQISDMCFNSTPNANNPNISIDNASNVIPWSIDHSSYYASVNSRYLFYDITVPNWGMSFDHLNCVWGSMFRNISGILSTTSSSSLTLSEIKNCIHIANFGRMSMGTVSTFFDMHDNVFQNNSASGWFWMGGFNFNHYNNEYWGCNAANITLYTTISPANWSNNTFNQSIYGVSFQNYYPTFKLIMSNDSYGNEVANSVDFTTGNSCYVDAEMASPTGTISTTLSTVQKYMLTNSIFRITDLNNVSNVDVSYLPYVTITRCGDGLIDTTAHTLGTGKFSMKFTPNDSTFYSDYEFNVYSGNIQNEDVTISCWCKINNANYYAGTHINPTLTVDYDNGTEVTAVATNTTDWQLLTVTFTPTTTYGKLAVKLHGATDETSTDADFYVDDFGGGYLSNGGLDLWANGLPVPPAWRFTVTGDEVGAAVWNYLSANVTTTGSMGKTVKSTKTLLLAG